MELHEGVTATGSTMAMLNGKTLQVAGLSAALRGIGHSSPNMHAAKAR